jgi:site-specific DNA recombinase
MRKAPRCYRVTVPLRAAVVARLSDDKNDRESLDDQVRRGREHCERNGWSIVLTVVENDTSAYKPVDREDFDQLITWIEQGKLDVVVARHQDRLTRDPEVFHSRLAPACIRARVKLSFYRGGELDLSTAEGGLRGGQTVMYDWYESAKRSERVRDAVRRDAEQGKISGGGPRPFGYRRIYNYDLPPNPTAREKRGRRIVREELEPAEAQMIQDAAEEVLTGTGCGAVAAAWRAAGVLTPLGKAWTTGDVRRVLTSARIAGLREYDGEIVCEKTEWPAIIDRDTWERLRVVLRDPARRTRPVGVHRRYLLSGWLYCGRCGRVLLSHPTKDRPLAYVCPHAGQRGCNGTRISAEPLTTWVVEGVLSRLESPAIGAAVLATQDTDAARHAVLADRTAAQERLTQARADYADGVIDRADWLAIRDRLTGTIDRLSREHDRLMQGAALTLLDPDQPVRQAWEQWTAAGDLDRRRALLGAVLDKVTVGPWPAGMGRRPHPDKAVQAARDVAMLEARLEVAWRV